MFVERIEIIILLGWWYLTRSHQPKATAFVRHTRRPLFTRLANYSCIQQTSFPAPVNYMLGRTCLLKHVTRHPLQFAPARPIQRANFPQQSRFYARPKVKGVHPLWYTAIFIGGFTAVFFITKTRRGLGSSFCMHFLRDRSNESGGE